MSEEDDMPVPCYLCENIINLNDANFFTKACECVDTCTHGICDDCKDTFEDTPLK